MNRDLTLLFGRLTLALIFVLSAVGKFSSFSGIAGMLSQQKHLPAATLLLGIAMFLELVGGLLVLSGFKTRIGAIFLIIFMVPVSLVMHNFWAYQGPEQMNQMINFLKNVSIVGGLLVLFASGPGKYSVDRG
jgi:putative oxidoreductase